MTFSGRLASCGYNTCKNTHQNILKIYSKNVNIGKEVPRGSHAEHTKWFNLRYFTTQLTQTDNEITLKNNFNIHILSKYFLHWSGRWIVWKYHDMFKLSDQNLAMLYIVYRALFQHTNPLRVCMLKRRNWPWRDKILKWFLTWQENHFELKSHT